MNKEPRTRRKASIGEKMVDEAWSSVLASIDSRAQRRGKTSMKQGEVGAVTVSNGRLVAGVRRRGPDRRQGKVSLPLIDDWTVYRKSVATWFCQRPDWLSALMAGQWDEEFLEFIAGNGLQLFPHQGSVDKWLSQAECGCGEWEQPCHHVAALIHRIVDEVNEVPLKALSFVGLEVEDVLDEAHALSADAVPTYASAVQDASAEHGTQQHDTGAASAQAASAQQGTARAHGEPVPPRADARDDGDTVDAGTRAGGAGGVHARTEIESLASKGNLGSESHCWLEERTVLAPSNQHAKSEENNRTTDPNDGWIKRNLLFPALDEEKLSDLTSRYLHAT